MLRTPPADMTTTNTALRDEALPLPAWSHPRAVLPLLALWLLATTWMRPLLLPDEGRYSDVAREMLLGDGLVPLLNGLPFFHKPPLMYWVDMAGMQLFGVNVFAVRMAPVLGAWVIGAGLYLDVRRRIGQRAAAITLAVVATCPFLFYGGQYANHDMLVAGMITLAVLCGQRAVDDPGRTDRRWLAAAWAAMALGVLSKGLIGVVLPSMVLGPWLLAQGRWRQCLSLLHPVGPLVFLAIAAPWFAAMQMRYPAFLDYFFVDQHFRRFAKTGFNNPQPFYFYLGVMPLLTVPWIGWIGSVWKLVRQPSGAATSTAMPTSPRFQPGFYVWWSLAVLIFFSLPQSKLVGYILPALAPLGGLLGVAASQGRAWRKVLPLAAVLCLGIIGYLAWEAPKSNRDVGRALAAQLQPGDRVVYVDSPFFDVSFYANLRDPAIVLSDWDDPGISGGDNWRKELFDGGRFAPAMAKAKLWRLSDAAQLLCAPGTVWIVAGVHWKPTPDLQGVEQALAGRNGTLWRAAGGPRAGCR